MFLATRALSINPAFLREIKDDNRELRHLLARSAAMVQEAVVAGQPSRQLAETLGKLRDQLGFHFSLEEAYGYFENAVAVPARWSHQADQLRGEHLALYREACGLAESAERWLYGELPTGKEESLEPRFEVFSRRLTQHEQAENELILAMLDDAPLGEP